VPVTFGGGSWMQNGAVPGRIDGLNKPWPSQYGYHFASMARGSKLLPKVIAIAGISRKNMTL
jgi:hypothetical protein